MHNDHISLWRDTLALIQNEVTEVSYRTWFLPIVPLSIDGNILSVELEQEIQRSMVAGRYRDLIESCMRVATGKPFALQVYITGELPDPIVEEAPPQADLSISINPKYTFDKFVVGSNNRFAHAASLAVAEEPAKAYNPLFLYGGAGLGKTHLLHAIGNYIVAQNAGAKVKYITSETFTNELINAIKTNKNEDFRNKYRLVDVLLVDDIQFIGGKESTQEEFFHTFNTLYGNNKQIIMTSDRLPKEIKTLEDRLRSRFECGLIGDIQPPDYETRMAILQKKAQNDGITIPMAVVELIAEKVKSNIRELEGVMNRVVAYSELIKQPLTVELAEEALKEIFSGTNQSKVSIDRIKSEVCKYYTIAPYDLTSKRKTKEIAHVRQIAMYLCRTLTDMSLPRIGDEFGGRDHTTVIHAINKVEENLKTDQQLKIELVDLGKNIKEE